MRPGMKRLIVGKGDRGEQQRGGRRTLSAQPLRDARDEQQISEEQQPRIGQHHRQLGAMGAEERREEEDQQRGTGVGDPRPVHRCAARGTQPMLRQIVEALAAQPVADLREARHVLVVGEAQQREVRPVP